MTVSLDLGPRPGLHHQAYQEPFFSNELFHSLVVQFQGSLGDASAGSDNARFMEAMTEAYIAYSRPWALVFDLRELACNDNADLMHVLTIGSRRHGQERLPCAVVTSSINDAFIRTQLHQNGNSSRMLLSNVPEALRFVDRQHWSYANHQLRQNQRQPHRGQRRGFSLEAAEPSDLRVRCL